ncbi:MAG TPA: dihydrolipoamide acetyltransferase family protein [Solirubrobacteraceae bacterium]
MPRLSDSMEEGTILRWLVADGSEVQRGQELAEIETDKASMVYEADASGILRIVALEGDTLPVGAPIAQLLEPGEQPPEPTSNGHAGQVNGSAEVTAKPTPEPAATAAVTPEKRALQPAGSPSPEKRALQPAASPSGRVKASPLARRLAAEAGLDLASITGSGPGGRVVKADVERATEGTTAVSASATAASTQAGTPTKAAPAGPVKGESEVVELTRTQELIARRMAEAKATIPEFTLQSDVDMEAAVALRMELKALAERREQAAPSFNDLVVKACALALKEHRRANGTYRDGHFELHGRVNVGVAVASKDALVVPVVRDADVLSVWEIAAETRRLAAAVREGTITPPELSGGTFSVSNLGMFGVDAFTAVINPPQAAILAVGSLAQRPVARGGELAIRHTMNVTLSCDHRILYGADAAEFLAGVRELLQQPLALLA